MKRIPSLLALIAIIVSVQHVNSYKVLTIFPMISRSHYIVGQALAKGLVAEGHEVTMISPFKEKQPIQNYHEVVLDGLAENMLKSTLKFRSQ